MTVAAERPTKPVLGIRLGQLVAWELSAMLLVFGVLSSGPARFPALGLGVLLLVGTAVRMQRRWMYDWLLTRFRFRSRGRGRVGHDTSSLAPLRTALPELVVSRAGGRSRVRLGVVHDGRAWISLVAVERGDDVIDGGATDAPLPTERLSELLRLDDIVFDSVQVLVQSVSAPAGRDAAAEMCPASYQELNKDRTVLSQSAWIVLRLDAARCPEAIAARGGDDAGIRRVLRRGVLRAVGILEDAGWQARVLDEVEAAESLASAAGVGAGGGEATRPVREAWTAWHGPDSDHVSYLVRDWKPSGSGFAEVQNLLGLFPARSTTISLTYTGRPQGAAAVSPLIRTTGAPAEANDALVRVAAERGIRLVRLDGEQSVGLLATLPLGRTAGHQALHAPESRGTGLSLRQEGMVLGSHRDGRTVTVRLLRRSPARLGVFLPREWAELVVFRTLCVGATVHVRSPQPQSWATLMRSAGVVPHRMVINLPGGATPPPGNQMAPVAIVDDFVGRPGAPRADLGTWHLGITLQPKAPSWTAEELRRYDAVLVPRVAPQTARALREAFQLPDTTLRMLPLMPADTAALVLPGRVEIIGLSPTRVEKGLLGVAERAYV
ncbi:type VII secretion protein EccE [Streptomyces sp. NPDC048629]|uniref:type VII secretion protein EccE n=1 Tax=Streptomyces sp. NPDC048629 TaxID=3154824 RepID=UPI00343B330A